MVYCFRFFLYGWGRLFFQKWFRERASQSRSWEFPSVLGVSLKIERIGTHLMGGALMGGEWFLSAFCMTVRCRWPSGERHRTVMQMLRSFGLPCARQGVSHLFGSTVFVCPVLRSIRPSQIPGSPPPRSPPTKESQKKLNRGVSKPGGFPLFSGKVQIVSRTLSGLFLVGALNSSEKEKGTNRENPRTIPEQSGKIPEKSGKSKKDKKGQKKKDKSRSGNPTV